MSPWLVRVIVDPRCHRVWSHGMLDGQALHRDIMRLAPDDLGAEARKAAGVLFRAEQTQTGLRILAQLTTPPQIERLAPDFAYNAQCRNVAEMLLSIDSGMQVRYRIDANATKRHGNSNPEKKGKLASLRGQEAEDWWRRRAADAGLTLLSVTSRAMPDILGSRTRDRDNHRRTTGHGVTRFEGIAVVSQPERVRAAVTEGIGRARTYGCGLLSIAPASTSAPEGP